jgi:hypothetical protein
VYLLPENDEYDEINVETVSIDATRSSWLSDPVAFIKCDVEGGEYDVVLGAMETLRQDRPALMLELYEPWCHLCGYSSQDVFSFLSRFGYRPFQVRSDRTLRQIASVPVTQRASHSTDYNVLFLHPEEHRRLIDRLVTAEVDSPKAT